MKLKFVLLPLFVVMLIAAVFTVPHAPAQSAPRRIEVTAKRFEFDPAEITVKKGEPVVIVLKSADVPHGLSFGILESMSKLLKDKPLSFPSPRPRLATSSASAQSSVDRATAI